MLLYVVVGVVLGCLVYLTDGRKIEHKIGIKRTNTDYDCMVSQAYSDW